jgi:hypothetical protein
LRNLGCDILAEIMKQGAEVVVTVFFTMLVSKVDERCDNPDKEREEE